MPLVTFFLWAMLVLCKILKIRLLRRSCLTARFSIMGFLTSLLRCFMTFLRLLGDSLSAIIASSRAMASRLGVPKPAHRGWLSTLVNLCHSGIYTILMYIRFSWTARRWWSGRWGY